MVQLRRRRKAGWEIARELDILVSTVSKHLKAEGVGRIWQLEAEQDPSRRYEHAASGDLFHIDAKKLARIEAVGHRIHGDRSRKQEGAGYEVVCVEDHTCLASITGTHRRYSQQLAAAQLLVEERGQDHPAVRRRVGVVGEDLAVRVEDVGDGQVVSGVQALIVPTREDLDHVVVERVSCILVPPLLPRCVAP